jgi:hypothetical protein
MVGMRIVYSGSKGILRVPERSGGRVVLMLTSRLWYMRTEFALKTAVQALSQICLTDRRDPDARVGKAWDLVVANGRFARGSCAVVVDVMMLPLGTMTWTAGLEVEMGVWVNLLVI